MPRTRFRMYEASGWLTALPYATNALVVLAKSSRTVYAGRDPKITTKKYRVLLIWTTARAPAQSEFAQLLDERFEQAVRPSDVPCLSVRAIRYTTALHGEHVCHSRDRGRRLVRKPDRCILANELCISLHFDVICVAVCRHRQDFEHNLQRIAVAGRQAGESRPSSGSARWFYVYCSGVDRSSFCKQYQTTMLSDLSCCLL